jgi:hypothetical protein
MDQQRREEANDRARNPRRDGKRSTKLSFGVASLIRR